ncbi:MAG: molybdate ABC transporter permease subunit [Magnetococcales bacterium]|nr:molybdate ABC transporter permease subunit [Magnetococcales bacterium]
MEHWVSPQDWQAIQLSLQLAAVTSALLLVGGTPLAWWLATSRHPARVWVEALVALPLVLPPTVLGFYLLILLGPNGWLGQWWQSLSGHTLSFTFSGLVVASLLYSLPFVIQPLQRSFEAIGKSTLEAAWSLGAGPWDTFWHVVLPLARRGYLTAGVLGFAHTLGEFGVVLMVGGNIPGQTQVIAILLYDHVESLHYAQAHLLSSLLLGFSFLALLGIYYLNRRTLLESR